MTIQPTRPEHTVAVTDALIARVLCATRTARDLRIASTALREGAEQREDAGVDASAWRRAFALAKDNAFRTTRGKTRPATIAGVRRAVAAIRSAFSDERRMALREVTDATLTLAPYSERAATVVVARAAGCSEADIIRARRGEPIA